jgi:glycosyltransferase involved in cell wall biosynthesis
MTAKPPRVSIGLPVFNGEEFLDEAIRSIVGQSFGDFELLISDNASTDRTWAIANEWASRDQRIRLHRFEENRGAARNFNYVFEGNQSEFFKWAAHDDVLEPDFLRECVTALDQDPRAIIAFPRARIIDGGGLPCDPGDTFDPEVTFESPDWQQRFRDLICRRHRCLAIFGVIRAGALRGAWPLENYSHADRILLGRLLFAGPFRQVDRELFLSRVHATASARLFSNARQLRLWWDPAQHRGSGLPHWRLFREYLRLAHSAAPSSPMERFTGYAEVLTSLRVRWWRRKLVADLKDQARSWAAERRRDARGGSSYETTSHS